MPYQIYQIFLDIYNQSKKPIEPTTKKPIEPTTKKPIEPTTKKSIEPTTKKSIEQNHEVYEWEFYYALL